VLVFATDLSCASPTWRPSGRRIAVVLLVSTAGLPVLAWAASLLIAAPELRSGIQSAGVAPAEVATVALCVIAGGEAALCAVFLVASTIITVLGVGPILSVLGHQPWCRRPGCSVTSRSWWRCPWRRGCAACGPGCGHAP